MGMKKGSSESVGIGALAKSANPTYHQHASIASGLGALANGMKAYANGWMAISRGLADLSKVAWKHADFAVDADRIKKENTRLAGELEAKVLDAEQKFKKDFGGMDASQMSSEQYTEYLRQQATIEALKDEAGKAHFRAENVTIYGVLKTPQPTYGRTDEEKKHRNSVYDAYETAIGVPKDEQKRGRDKPSDTYGAISWLNFEED